MKRTIDHSILKLKDKILEMGGTVEAAIDATVKYLMTNNSHLVEDILTYEAKINHLHIQIDTYCFNMFACQAPVATDLRFLLAVLKINTDLERMGDQSVNIVKNIPLTHSKIPPRCLMKLSKMAKEAQVMVKHALDAFVDNDIVLAKSILERDDTVDALDEEIFELVMNEVELDNVSKRELIDIVLISKNLERVADHATNIAEDVIFIASGQDIRHLNSASAIQ